MSKHWATEPEQSIEIKISSGFGGIVPKTIQQVFIDTVSKFGDRNALAVKRPINVRKNFVEKFIAFVHKCILFY
jgi:hypothetical protein